MKIALRVLCLAFLAMLIAPQSSSGAATSSYLCFYPKGKYIVPSGSQATYACPTSAPVPSGYTSGYNASDFQKSLGMNIHLTFSRYSTVYSYVKALLLSEHVVMARDNGIANIATNNPTLTANFNDLAANGICIDLITNNGNSASYIDGKVALLNPGVVCHVEGPNEMNLNEPSTYVTDGQSMMQAITSGVETQPHIKGIDIYGASLSNADYSVWNFSGYTNHNNTHDYMGGHNPESTGWGSLGYCGQNYQTNIYAACDAQQAAPGRDVVTTENGYCTAALVGCVPEDTQGLYMPRLLMQHYSLGITQLYPYELIEKDGTTADGTYGWVRVNNTQKPVIPEMAGFMSLLHDPGTLTGTCNVPVTLGTPSPATFAVRLFGVCKSDGSYAVALWLPPEDYNTNTQAYDTVNPETVAVNIAPGFTVTSSAQWTVSRTTGLWTPNPSWTPGNVSVTGPVQVLTINGPTPTPLPVMPTTPP